MIPPLCFWNEDWLAWTIGEGVADGDCDDVGSDDVDVDETEAEAEVRKIRMAIGELVANAPTPESVTAGINAGIPVTNFAAATY